MPLDEVGAAMKAKNGELQKQVDASNEEQKVDIHYDQGHHCDQHAVLDVVGDFECRSTDGKSEMVLQLDRKKEFVHIATRSDKTEYYNYNLSALNSRIASTLTQNQSQPASDSSWWSWLLLPFTCGGSSSSTSASADAARAEAARAEALQAAALQVQREWYREVHFWEKAVCYGTWEFAESFEEGHDIIVCLRCTGVKWESGQSDPMVPVYRLYQAEPLPEEKQRMECLASQGELMVHYAIDKTRRRLELIPPNAETNHNREAKALGFMGRYVDRQVLLQARQAHQQAQQQVRLVQQSQAQADAREDLQAVVVTARAHLLPSVGTWLAACPVQDVAAAHPAASVLPARVGSGNAIGGR